MGHLADIENFGTVGAEDDSTILQYFLSTNTVKQIESGKRLLILGRKGTGKTALVRYFENRRTNGSLHVSLKLRSYPWTLHAKRKISGASEIEVYVASWRYLIAVQTLSALFRSNTSLFLSPSAAVAKDFLTENYAITDVDLRKVLTPNKISIRSGSAKGSLFGLINKEINWEKPTNDLAANLDEITDAVFSLAASLALEQKITQIFLHFDELDQGLHTLKDDKRLLLTGLILSGREIRNTAKSLFSVRPVIYLRSDIWDQLVFADKNKIAQDLSHKLSWDSNSLLAMINLRISAKTGRDISWTDISELNKMRGTQEKWNYILSRTFLRPRDVIAYLNYSIGVALDRNPAADFFINDDIFKARSAYSQYLKNELDEEILPHWSHWEEAMRACSAIATMTVKKDRFEAEYAARRSSVNHVESAEALEILFGYSIIGYRRGRAKGGTEWVFQYANDNAKWDALTSSFKVHMGLKEYFGLAESSVE